MKLSTNQKISFNFCIAWLKLTTSDFQMTQKWFLYKYNALFPSITNLGKVLIPSKNHKKYH